MKTKLYLQSALILALLFTTAFSASATKHIVNVQNFTFSPANLPSVTVGDTIRWVWVSGTHTTTSTTIPAGAATWDSPITSSVTSYEYKVTLAGTYNYVCTPHAAMNMVGSFTASASTATLSVTPPNRNVPASSGTTTFNVTSNSSWTTSSNAAWCTVTPSGNGNGTITAAYTTNSSLTQRVATITVTVAGIPSQTVTVTQAGATATLLLSPSNQGVTSAAGTTTFNITSNSSWTAASNVSWCVVTPSGSGNGTLTATYEENTSVDPRIATITVTVQGIPSQVSTVTQAGATPTLAVSPANQNVSAAAGTASFNLLSNSAWTASSDAAWCEVTASGSGNSTITATYTENTTNVQRIATVTVNVNGIPSMNVTVSQAASTVGVKENPQSSFAVFPNPSQGKFTITPGSTFTGNSVLSITDQVGNTIYKSSVTGSDSFSLDLSSQPAGNYFVKMVSGGKSKVKLITITR